MPILRSARALEPTGVVGCGRHRWRARREKSIEIVTLKLSTHLAHSTFSQHTNFQIGAGTGTHPPGQREKNSPSAGQSMKLRAPTSEGWRARFCAPVRLRIPLGDHDHNAPSGPGHILSSRGRTGQRARRGLERGVETERALYRGACGPCLFDLKRCIRLLS